MATESQFTISPRNFEASARESAVLPLAVGPITTTNSGSAATVSVRPRGCDASNGRELSRESGERSRSGRWPRACRCAAPRREASWAQAGALVRRQARKHCSSDLMLNYASFAMSTPQASPAGRVIRFGVFEADLTAAELRKSGVRIRLQEQPFQVLAYLLQHPGEVVSREDLRQRLWPSDTFVDFDHSLNTAVNKLREALGDSASSPRYVETLARKGYRFVA